MYAFLKRIVLGVYRTWIKIGHVLGIINTFVILTLFYFCIITPMGLIKRIFKSKKAPSIPETFWKCRKPPLYDLKFYTRPF